MTMEIKPDTAFNANRSGPPFWRLALAFLIAPAVPAAIMAFDVWSDSASSASYLSYFKLVAILGAYPPAIILGIPTVLVLRHAVVPRLTTMALMGGVIASLPWLLLMLLSGGTKKSSTVGDYLVESVFPTFMLGMLGGAIFYGIAIAGRRNQAQ